MSDVLMVAKKLARTLVFVIRGDQRYGLTIVNVSRTLFSFWPNTSGSYRQLAEITLREVNEILPLIVSFGDNSFHVPTFSSIMFNEKQKNAEDLGTLLAQYGSDKSTGHDYHLVYATLLERNSVKKVLEIGIGSNNLSVPSNMGATGKPGASLRAFRDFYPNSKVIGLDFDPKTLFEDTRIQTFEIDTTSLESLSRLKTLVGEDFDLMIDDGLHSIVSSLNSLKYFLKLIRLGGYAVVEDIPEYSVSVYDLVGRLIQPEYECKLIECRGGWMFVAQRVS